MLTKVDKNSILTMEKFTYTCIRKGHKNSMYMYM